MATNFPSSLDNFTNPVSGNTLDSPSHSLQHSDANDAIEAIEAKLGVGNSPAGSATAGQVLTISAAGTSSWSTLPVDGLTQIIPSSVTVTGAGSSGSVSATGGVSFATSASVSVINCFSSTYQNYKIVLAITAATGNANLYVRWRNSSGDLSDASYERAGFKNYTSSSTISAMNQTGQDKWIFAGTLAAAGDRGGGTFEVQKPFDSSATIATYAGSNQDGGGLGHWSNSAIYTPSTSITGFSLIGDAGAFSGTIRIYGYRN